MLISDVFTNNIDEAKMVYGKKGREVVRKYRCIEVLLDFLLFNMVGAVLSTRGMFLGVNKGEITLQW